MATVKVHLLTHRRNQLLPRAVESLRTQPHSNWLCKLHKDAPDAPFPGVQVRRLAEPRIRVGETFFKRRRALLKDFSPAHCRRVLELWRRAPRGELAALGTRSFARLASLLGPLCAARILRLRNHRYAACATLAPEEYARLFPES